MKTIGFPISTKENECRRALTPQSLSLIKNRSQIYIESGYGDVLGYSDDEYLAFGGFEMEDLASDITVTVDGTLNGALVSFTATYNFDSFAQYHVENAELSYKSVACMSLIEALYDLANIAKEYSEAAAE